MPLCTVNSMIIVLDLQRDTITAMMNRQVTNISLGTINIQVMMMNNVQVCKVTSACCHGEEIGTYIIACCLNLKLRKFSCYN